MLEFDIYKKEAKIFGRYLLQKNPDENSINHYAKVMSSFSIALNEKEGRIMKFILRNPWSISFIDAGLGILSPKSQVRRKIYCMSAILECSPGNSKIFISGSTSFAYTFYIAWVLIRSVLKASAGCILIKLI